MKKILTKLTWKDAVLPLPALIVIILWTLLSSCNKEHVTPNPPSSIYKSVVGDWKYESDTIKVYFTITDSIGNKWATRGVVYYKGLTQHQIPSEVAVADVTYSIVCNNLNAIVTSPVARSDYTSIQGRLILYHGLPNPIIIDNVTIKRK